VARLKTRPPFASRAKQLVPVEDMTGGVDLRRSPTLIAPNRGQTYLNCSLEEPGALQMRPQYTQASTGPLFAGPPQGGQRVYLARSVFTLLAGNGAVYRPSDVWASTGPVYSTISSTNQVYFPHDRDLVMVMDGANRPRFSTNGADWYLAGSDAPSTSAVLSSKQSGSGILSTGEYAVVYTYKHRGTSHESNPSAESTITLTASTANSIEAQATPSTDAKHDAYVWYARHKLPDLESVLRKVSSGAASTYTILSSAWTTNDEAPSNHNVPPVGLRFGAAWKSRWWAPSGTIGNRLHFTELFLPQAWPSLYFIDIPFEKGDSITAIQPLGDTLLVFGDSGVFLIIGQTSLDFEVRPAQGADAGALGPRAVARVEQAVLHAGGGGVASFDGAGDRDVIHDIAPAWLDLIQNSLSTDLAKVALLHDRLRHELRVSVPRVYPTGTRGEWILNLDRTRDAEGQPAWTTTDRDIAFYIHFDGNEPTTGNRGRVFSLPSTSGTVNEENDGYSANGSNARMEYDGPGLSLGLHRARVVDLHLEYEPHAGVLSVEPSVDGESVGTFPLSIGAGQAVYDTALYDTDAYAGSGRRKAYTPLPINSDGRSVSLRITYTGQEQMKVFTYALGIVPERQPRQMTE
jgi:hypothetical protein